MEEGSDVIPQGSHNIALQRLRRIEELERNAKIDNCIKIILSIVIIIFEWRK